MKLNRALLIPILLFFFASCQKPPDVDLNELPPVADSTKLIKSILYITHHDPGVADSLLETYDYDSLNRTVTASWTGYGNYIYETGISADFKYNERGYLTSVNYKYPVGYPPEASIAKVILTYDQTDIIRSIQMTNREDSVYSIYFTKSDTASGYTLSWTDYTYGMSKAKFDASGKCVISRFEYLGDSLPGILPIIVYDSISYDAAGNATSIYQHAASPGTTPWKRLRCEFISRETKGDELYLQKQYLLKGVANLPDNGSIFFSRFFGVLSYGNDESSQFQYHRYPIREASAYNPYVINTYRTFTAENEFDDLDRLSVFTAYKNDEQLSTNTYKITYYK